MPDINVSTTIKIVGLTSDHVSITFVTETTIGDKTYTDDPLWYNRANSEIEREDLRQTLETDYPGYYAAVMALWGDTPTVLPEEEIF